MRFSPKKCLPVSKNLEGYHSLINLVGVKLMILYYSRILGIELRFEPVHELTTDLFRVFASKSYGSSWTQTGLEFLYSEQIGLDTTFSGYLDLEEYGFDTESLAEDNYEGVLGLDTIISYTWLAKYSSFSEEEAYEPSELQLEDLDKIFFDHFISSKKLPYPDTDGGRLAEMAIDGVINMIYEGRNIWDMSYEFLENSAFEFCNLLQCIFTVGNEMFNEHRYNPEFNCYSFLHPYGQSVLNFLSAFNDKNDENYAFYRKSKEIVDACLNLLNSGKCETGENPDWYEHYIHTDGKSLAIGIIYSYTVGHDITVIVLAVYLLKHVIDEVYCKAENLLHGMETIEKI